MGIFFLLSLSIICIFVAGVQSRGKGQRGQRNNVYFIRRPNKPIPCDYCWGCISHLSNSNLHIVQCNEDKINRTEGRKSERKESDEKMSLIGKKLSSGKVEKDPAIDSTQWDPI